MTNLPITINNPQSPASGALGIAAFSRSDPAAASVNATSASQTNSAANDQAAEAFSVLLARQISEAGLPAMDTTQISAAIDGKAKAAADDKDATAKDAQDQTTIATGTSSDPASSLAAMLLQIPVQQTDTPSRDAPVVDTLQLRGALSADSGTGIGTGISYPLTKGTGVIKQGKNDSLQQTSGRPAAVDSALTTPDIRQLIDSSLLIPPASDAVKNAETATSPAGQPQTSQNNSNAALLIPLASDAAKIVETATSPAGQLQNSLSNSKAMVTEAASAMPPNIMVSGTPANMANTIAAPIGSKIWADEFSQKVVWMSSQQNQVAELHLNPPDLGPLNVLLKMSDNQLTAQFTSPHSAVRDAVENALPKLREILADNNIMLGNATVSDQPPRDRSGEGFMNQGSGTAAQRETSYNSIESNKPSSAIVQSVPARRHNGMLDIFA